MTFLGFEPNFYRYFRYFESLFCNKIVEIQSYNICEEIIASNSSITLFSHEKLCPKLIWKYSLPFSCEWSHSLLLSKKSHHKEILIFLISLSPPFLISIFNVHFFLLHSPPTCKTKSPSKYLHLFLNAKLDENISMIFLIGCWVGFVN